MSTQPEALRLADALTQPTYPDWLLHIPAPWHPPAQKVREAAAELRRLHAENERLSAALASSCDEARDQLWESGGIAGCSRALSAEFQCAALLEVLKYIDAEFRKHGRQHWPEAVRARAAIAAVEGEKT